jgi:hypothetical protein
MKKRKEGRGRRMMTGQTNNTDGKCIQEKESKSKWYNRSRKERKEMKDIDTQGVIFSKKLNLQVSGSNEEMY